MAPLFCFQMLIQIILHAVQLISHHLLGGHNLLEFQNENKDPFGHFDRHISCPHQKCWALYRQSRTFPVNPDLGFHLYSNFSSTYFVKQCDGVCRVFEIYDRVRRTLHIAQLSECLSIGSGRMLAHPQPRKHSD